MPGLGGVPGLGGCLLWGGVPAPGGCLVEIPPGGLLLRAVRILLECILVLKRKFGDQSYLWGHQYPCLGLLMTSALAYRVCGALCAVAIWLPIGVFFSMFNRAENPQIDNIENPHFCTFSPAQDGLPRFTSKCNTCQPLGSKHGSPFTSSGFISAIHGN